MTFEEWWDTSPMKDVRLCINDPELGFLIEEAIMEGCKQTWDQATLDFMESLSGGADREELYRQLTRKLTAVSEVYRARN